MPTPLILKIDVDDKGNPKIEKLKGNIKDLGNTTDDASKKVGKFEAALKKKNMILDNTVKKMFSLRGVIAAVAAAYAALKIAKIVKGWMDLAGAQEAAEAGMRQVMVSMGRYSDSAYINYLKTAQALQKLTGVGDEAIITGQKFLLTFKQIPDDLMPKSSKAMLDLAALMGGDVQRAALTLGKAAMGLTGELRRVGITVGNDTFKLKGYAGVLKEIEEQVKGQAEVFRKTWPGTLQAFKSEVGDVKEVFGEAFKLVMQPAVEDLITRLQDLKEGSKLEEWAKEAAKGVITAIEIMVKGFGGLLEIINFVRYAFSQMSEWYYKRELAQVTKSLMSMADTVAQREAAIAGKGGGIYAIQAKLFPEDALRNLEDDRKLLADLMDQRDELNEKIEASGLMGEDALKKEAAVLEKIEGYMSSLEGIKSNIDKTPLTVLGGKKTPGSDLGVAQPGGPGAASEVERVVSEAEKAWLGEAKQKRMAEIEKRLAQDFGTVWKATTKSMEDTFVDGFSSMLQGGLGSFREFGKQILKIFSGTMSQMISEKFFRPIANQMTSAITAPLQGIFSSVAGSAGGAGTGLAGFFSSGIGKNLGSGLMGAGVAGAMGAGTGGTIGAGLGGLVGSFLPGIGNIIGAGLGGVIGSIFDKKKKDPPPVPEIDLAYEVIEGDLRLIRNRWVATSKSNELLDAIKNVMQTQIDFYESAAEVIGSQMDDFTFSLHAIGTNLASDMEALTGKAVVTSAISQFDMLASALGPIFEEGFIDLFEAMLKSTNLLPGLDIEALYEQLGSFFEQAGWDMPTLGTYMANILGSMTQRVSPDFWDQWGEEFEKFLGESSTQLTTLRTSLSEAVTGAFLDSATSGRFTTFTNLVKEGIGKKIKEGIISGFATEMYKQIETALWGSIGGMFGLSDLVSEAASSLLSGGSGSEGLDSLISNFQNIGSVISDLQPIWDVLSEGMNSLVEQLGLNTSAVTDNTSILTEQQQIQDFISELTTGTYAPVQSVGAIEQRYQELLGSGDLNSLFGFITGTALPFYQSYGGDYQTQFSSIISDLQNLSGMYGAGITPESIGEAVAGAIVPVIGSQPIQVQIIVDGKVLSEVMVDQLDSNTQLVQAVQEAVA